MTQPPPQPGYFMTNATVTQTDANGQPLYRMTAQRIQQNPKTQTITLQNLKLNYAPQENNQWTLTALSGRIPSIESKTIDLRGDVRITGRPSVGADTAPTQPALIRTASLKIDAAAGTASTHNRVYLSWGDRQLSGTGLTADLKAGRVKLESSVHGRFIQ